MKTLGEIGQERSEWKGEERQRWGRCKRGKTRVAAEGRRPIRRTEPDGETRGAELGKDEKKEKQ